MAKRKMRTSKFDELVAAYDPRYYLPNIRSGAGWADESEMRSELRRLKKNVRARLRRLEQSQYADIGMKRLMEVPFADVLTNSNAFSLEEQLAGYARLYYENVSITGIRQSVKQAQEWAGMVWQQYADQYGGAVGFNEFMAAARYAGLMDTYGSDQVYRMYENIEENNLDVAQVFENFAMFARRT